MAASDNALRDDEGCCVTCRTAHAHASWCPVAHDQAHALGYGSVEEQVEYQRAFAVGYPSPTELRRATRGQPHQRTVTWLHEHHLAWMDGHGDCVASNIRCGSTGCRVPREWSPQLGPTLSLAARVRHRREVYL